MRRDEAVKLLAELGVTSLALFGSVARDEARPDSDVDLLVEVRRPMGLFEFIGIKQRLEEIFGRSVDLIMRTALKPRLRDGALREAIPIFSTVEVG